MDNCVWVASGYPVLAAAIAVLWTCLRKSERERLRREQEHSATLREIKELLSRGR